MIRFKIKKTRQRNLVFDILINQLAHIYKAVNFYYTQIDKSLYIKTLVSEYTFLLL